MSNSKLNNRLLKLAEVFDAAVANSDSNQNRGAWFAKHWQNLGTMDPLSPEGVAYRQQHNITLRQAQKFYDAGQKFLQAGSTNFSNLQQALDSGNYNAIAKSPEFQELMQEFNTDAFSDLGRANLVRQTPAFQEQYNSTLYESGWMPEFADRWADNAAAFSNQSELKTNPIYTQQAIAQLGEGFTGAFDFNAPIWRKQFSNLATNYFRSKIDEWAPRNTQWGQALNSFGNLAVGLASNMPGYETLTNSAVHWMYGDKLKDAPKQLQDYFRNNTAKMPTSIGTNSPSTAQLNQNVNTGNPNYVAQDMNRKSPTDPLGKMPGGG